MDSKGNAKGVEEEELYPLCSCEDLLGLLVPIGKSTGQFDFGLHLVQGLQSVFLLLAQWRGIFICHNWVDLSFCSLLFTFSCREGWWQKRKRRKSKRKKE